MLKPIRSSECVFRSRFTGIPGQPSQMGVKVKKNTMSAIEADNNFGYLIESARSNPVRIERNGRPVVVVISTEELDPLEALEDAWWANEAQKAMAEGTIGEEESKKRLAQRLNAKD